MSSQPCAVWCGLFLPVCSLLEPPQRQPHPRFEAHVLLGAHPLLLMLQLLLLWGLLSCRPTVPRVHVPAHPVPDARAAGEHMDSPQAVWWVHIQMPNQMPIQMPIQMSFRFQMPIQMPTMHGLMEVSDLGPADPLLISGQHTMHWLSLQCLMVSWREHISWLCHVVLSTT